MHRLVLFLFCGLALSVDPGIKIEMTGEGVSKLESVIESLLIPIINASQPFPLNQTFYQSALDGTAWAQVGNLSMTDIEWDDIALSIVPGQGLLFTITDLSLSLIYTLTYELPFGSPQVANNVATLTQTNVIVNFTIYNANGRPFAIMGEPVIDVGPIAWGFSGILEGIFDILGPIIVSTLSGQISSTIQTTAQPIIDAQLARFTPHISILPDQPFYLDISLLDNPFFGEDLIAFGALGTVRTEETPCPYLPKPFPEDNEDDIRVYISESLPSCLLNAFTQTDILNGLVRSFFPVNSPIAYLIDFGEGSQTKIESSGVGIDLNTTVSVVRAGSKNETYVELHGDSEIDLDVSFISKDRNMTYTVIANITAITFSDLSVEYVAMDMPSVYKDQIANSNFTAMADRLNSFVGSTVLPQVNTKLTNGTLVPHNITQYLKEPQLKFMDGYLLMVTDLQL